MLKAQLEVAETVRSLKDSKAAGRHEAGSFRKVSLFKDMKHIEKLPRDCKKDVARLSHLQGEINKKSVHYHHGSL